MDGIGFVLLAHSVIVSAIVAVLYCIVYFRCNCEWIGGCSCGCHCWYYCKCIVCVIVGVSK